MRGWDLSHLTMPPEWEGRTHISVAEFREWLDRARSRLKGSSPRSLGGKRNSEARRRPDLGNRYYRSKLEANFARFLIFLGYAEWTNKEEDPPLPGRWFRYEGKRWTFPQRTRNGHYKADFEVWPGVIDPTRPYEVIELKGWLDDDSRIRLDRMRRYYPDVPVELVTSDRFKALTKSARQHIPNWE